jgi:prepilin-type N-terminal cleavage/methylation domain-containing protein
MRRPFSRRGFTFVEVLIVVALFSLVGVALFGSFTAGLRAWKAASNPDFSRRKALLGLERFTQDLHTSVDFSFLTSLGLMSFVGDPQGCSFFQRRDGNIYNIMYIYYDGTGTVARVASALGSASEIMNPGRPRMVMTRVRSFELLYAGNEQLMGRKGLLEEWNSSSMGLPKAVKIHVELEDGQTYERTVILPAALS